ncbi:hypothetical protein OEZ86_011295 [Tetradesmus obliquus]|nr:hypothetical protein OEZ86_011295 [Tetradesmus obliquus]
MLVWEQGGPRRVLIVKKPVPAAGAQLEEMATWLQQQGLQVFVERAVHQQEFPQFAPFDPATTDIDFAITLGGDGTVLYLASLFTGDVPLPPVMCFAMGTLGFLTPFDATQYRACLQWVLAANREHLYCTLRTRKRCAVLNAAGELLRVHHILNECVIDRGAFPSSVFLEVYIDGGFVTAAEADGLIIATPSGSTAYSMSAGGSMVAPSVPCTLLTPLSPHSLSFRPLIIPENADLLVRLPRNARSHARASFDGKHPMRIERGGSVHFQTSLCPLPLINIGSLDRDWYEGITHKLKWNQTIRGAPGRAAAAGNLSSPSLHTLLRTARGSSNGHGGTDDDVAAGSTAGTFSAVPPVAPGVPGSQFWQQDVIA